MGAPLAAALLRSLISHIREYAADEGAARLSGKSVGLAGALAKLQYGVQRFPIERGNPAPSQLLIIDPLFGGQQRLFYLYSLLMIVIRPG